MKKSKLRQIIREELRLLTEKKWSADDSVGGDEQDLISSKIQSKSKFFPGIQPGDKISFKISNIKYKNGICLGFAKFGQPGRSMFVELPNKKYTLIDALIDGDNITNVKRNGKQVSSGVKIKENIQIISEGNIKSEEEMENLNEIKKPKKLYNEFQNLIKNIKLYYDNDKEKDSGLRSIYLKIVKDLKIFSQYLDYRYGKGKW